MRLAEYAKLAEERLKAATDRIVQLESGDLCQGLPARLMRRVLTDLRELQNSSAAGNSLPMTRSSSAKAGKNLSS